VELEKINLKSSHLRMLADVITPVSVYLKLRDKYANSILLESSDYHGAENSYSYICSNPVASFVLKNNRVTLTWPDGVSEEKMLENPRLAVEMLSDFMQSFIIEKAAFKFITDGLFGYIAYDAVKYFEDITVQQKKKG
jgi:anthranilate synthase component I